MGGHIDCYLDVASFYGYIALTCLLKNREKLASHDVSTDFIPVFLGGINVGSGNKPPFSLPAKAAYGKFDSSRALKYHGLDKLEAADFFPPLTILPLRALCFIKAKYSGEVLEKVLFAFFHAMWKPPNINITIPASLVDVLTDSGLFSDEQIKEIMQKATEKEWKDKLLANTQKALDLGAFGAPWLWVTNGQGISEPFFGSDRFHFIYQFLGLPFQDIELLYKGEQKAKL